MASIGWKSISRERRQKWRSRQQCGDALHGKQGFKSGFIFRVWMDQSPFLTSSFPSRGDGRPHACSTHPADAQPNPSPGASLPALTVTLCMYWCLPGKEPQALSRHPLWWYSQGFSLGRMRNKPHDREIKMGLKSRASIQNTVTPVARVWTEKLLGSQAGFPPQNPSLGHYVNEG